MQLFYHPELTANSEEVTFDKTESRHIIRVLRKDVGDTLHITNGQGILFTARINIPNDKKCVANINKQERQDKPYKTYLHIAIAPTKSNDRFEWFVEKATEIGIDEITPIICDHSERKQVKIERMQNTAIAALKQSLQTHLPKINEALPFKKFIEQHSVTQQFIAHCEQGEKILLKNCFESQKNTRILIGPEGDFTPKEIENASKNDYIPISLGPQRLRTETAALVACNSIRLFE